MKDKVMVAMSGGVDSSVAALLLQNQGYEVAGATFLLWEDTAKAAEDAKAVCDYLGIPHHLLDYRELFRDHVMNPFVDDYRNGRTPNPCIFCNRNIKFGAFLRDAKRLGYDLISTGHYVRTEPALESGRVRLRRALSGRKDQSYVLYMLSQSQLRAMVIPLGGMEKEEVRRIALESGLPVANRPESQDICFVPDGDYAAFLERYTGFCCPPGNFVDLNGSTLGRHSGIWRYTIGQRKGLGVGFGKPVYVQAVNAEKNSIVLGPNETLFRRQLTASGLNWIDFDTLAEPLRVQARIRYSHKPANALITPLGDDLVQVVFDEEQRAVTKGQAVVFYHGEYVVGGGTILD